MKKSILTLLLTGIFSIAHADGPKNNNFEKTYTDVNGTHKVSFEIKQIKSDSPEFASYALSVNSVDKDGKTEWKIKDGVNNCPVDVSLEFFTKLIEITDNNKDGYSEITIPYNMFCGGGVDPYEVKIIVVEQNKKYVLRGQSMYYANNEKNYNGEGFKLDQTIESKPYLKTQILKTWSAIHKHK